MIATLQSAGAGVSGCDGHDVGVSGPDAGVNVPGAGVSGCDGHDVGVGGPDAGVSVPGAGVSGCDASRSGVPDDDDDDEASMNNFCPEVVRAIEGVKFIAEHLKREDEARYVSYDADTIRYDTVSVRSIKPTHVGFRVHVKIASRIVSYRTEQFEN